MTSNKISQTEFTIMQVLWSQNQATSQEVISILSKSTDWKANTIQVMLSRLVRKGVVGVRKRGRYNVYFPTISEGDRSRNQVENADHICARKIGKRIVEMIQDNALSFEDLENIQMALNAKEAFAVAEVLCNCPPGKCTCKNCNCRKEDRKFTSTPANSTSDISMATDQSQEKQRSLATELKTESKGGCCGS